MCLLIHGWHRIAWYVAITGVESAVLVPVTKVFSGPARPQLPIPLVELPAVASFPSGQAMTSMVTWGVLLLVALPGVRPKVRRLWITATALLIMMVGFTRIALAVHFLFDVLAGWALRLAWLAVVTLTVRHWLHSSNNATAAVATGALTTGGSDGTEPMLPEGARTRYKPGAGVGGRSRRGHASRSGAHLPPDLRRRDARRPRPDRGSSRMRALSRRPVWPTLAVGTTRFD